GSAASPCVAWRRPTGRISGTATHITAAGDRRACERPPRVSDRGPPCTPFATARPRYGAPRRGDGGPEPDEVAADRGAAGTPWGRRRSNTLGEGPDTRHPLRRTRPAGGR